jgi:glutamate--cysteine ligase catalytic subunit
MEVQMTDFENAAFTVFSVLVTRVVLAFDLALYIPLSKVDENMQRAAAVDACRTKKFFFRKNLAASSSARDGGEAGASGDVGSNPATAALLKSLSGCDLSSQAVDTSGLCNGASKVCGDTGVEDMYEEMTMDEIFNGKACYFPGLIPLVYAYLEYINADSETFNRIDLYLQFIAK